MLTDVVVVSPPGAFWPDLVMKIYPGPTDPLIIHDIKGLEPVAADVNTHAYGGGDGEFYAGSHIGKRNIVITFGLNDYAGSDSVAAARRALYFYFMPKSFKSKLRFVFDNRSSVEIEGYTESTEGDRFVQDPEMQVSFICPKPHFWALPVRQVSGKSNEANSLVPYEGSAAGGFVLELLGGNDGYYGDVFIESKVPSEPLWRTIAFYPITIWQGSSLFVSTHQGYKRAEVRLIVNIPVNQIVMG